MKKLFLVSAAFVSAISSFAYYGDYGYSRHDEGMSGFAIFTLIVMIAYIILSIVILIRWWKMTQNVQRLTQHLTPSNPKISYLIAIGEREKAEKAALVMMIDLLFPIYNNVTEFEKARVMNEIISYRIPKLKRLGITVPDYVTSGEKFIDYMNDLTGNKVRYKSLDTSN